MSLGTRLILMYLLAAYFLPAAALVVTGHQSDFYRDPSLTTAQLLYGVMVFAVVILASIDRSPVWQYRLPALKPPRFAFELGVVLVLLASVAVGFSDGLARWRYSNEGLSENLSLTSIAYVLGPSIFEVLLFLEIFCFADVPGQGLQRRAMTFLIAIGLALTASGIGPMLVVLVAVLYAIFPAQFRVLIFRDYQPAGGTGLSTKLGVVPMAGAALASLAIAFIVGEQIKTGSDTDVVAGYWGNLSYGDYGNYLVERFSTAWVSLKVALSEYTTLSWGQVAANLWAPIGNFLFRLDALTGGAFGIPRPQAGSLMRLNYEMISIYASNEREGTSPGLIGGFLMAFPMPFSLVVIGFYTYLQRTMFNYLGAGFAGAPTWIGTILALYFFFSFFASPVDYFLIFDNGFFSIAMYVGVALFIRSRFKSGIRSHV